MRVRVLVSSLMVALLAGCSGSDSQPAGPGLSDIVKMVGTLGGDVGTLQGGALPSQGAGPTASADNASAILPGGSALFDVSGSGSFDAIYVAVDGLAGYWRVNVSPGTDETVILSIGQGAPHTFTLVFGLSSGGVAGTFDLVPVTLTAVGTGPIQVSVTWDAESDVDLHLVEPGGAEIYYANPTSASGGSLDLDSNAACSLDGVKNENITYAGGSPPHGTYTVRVDYWDACSVAQTNAVVTVNVNGAVQTYNHTFTGAGDQGGAGSGATIATFTY